MEIHSFEFNLSPAEGFLALHGLQGEPVVTMLTVGSLS